MHYSREVRQNGDDHAGNNSQEEAQVVECIWKTQYATADVCGNLKDPANEDVQNEVRSPKKRILVPIMISQMMMYRMRAYRLRKLFSGCIAPWLYCLKNLAI